MALVNKVLPVYIVFQLFEAVCVSTALVGSRPPSPSPSSWALPEASMGCQD